MSLKDLIERSVMVVDKPPGPTSREVVERIKDILECKKAGHTGVLDPRASGVLVVALNKAVKLMPVLMGLDKEYEGVMYLHKDVDFKTIEKVISKHFIGEITQIPPVKSRVARKPRKRKVHYFKILEKEGKNVKFRTKVQAGTYIRKLCHDIGVKLGTGAHLKELRRLSVGHFKLKDSHTLEEIEKAYEEFKRGREEKLKKILIPIEKAIPHVKKVYVSQESVERIRNGAPVFSKDILNTEEGVKAGERVAIFSGQTLIALGIAKFNGNLKRKRGSVIRTDRVI